MPAPTGDRPITAATAAVLTFLVLAACGRSDRAASPSAASVETPVAAEINPAGDISDSQAFVEYASPAGYALKVPEGWARTVRGADVTFIDKLDGISVSLSRTAESLASIKAAARAGSNFSAKDVTLPAGHAVEVRFSSNSEPDQVTEKKIRLENEAVIFEHGALHATLRVWAPSGADNVDQWNAIEGSFRFR